MHEEVKATFALAEKDGFAEGQAESVRFVEKGHGRLETREYWTPFRDRFFDKRSKRAKCIF